MNAVHIGVINVSDRAAAGVYDDVPGKAVVETLREYLTHRRLLRAEDLIRTTDLTFADIAERCGFRHHEYLGYILRNAHRSLLGVVYSNKFIKTSITAHVVGN